MAKFGIVGVSLKTDKSDNWWSKWRQLISDPISWLEVSFDVTLIINYHSYQFEIEMSKTGPLVDFNCNQKVR